MIKQSLSLLLALYLVMLWHPGNSKGDEPGQRESSTSYWAEAGIVQRVVISKSRKELLYQENGQAMLSCPVAVSKKRERKKRRGDGCTPEGRFTVAGRYRNALLLDYPDTSTAFEALSAREITRAQSRAIEEAHRLHLLPPQDTPLGSYLSLRPGDTRQSTRGDIRMADKDFTWLASRLREGATIEILP